MDSEESKTCHYVREKNIKKQKYNEILPKYIFYVSDNLHLFFSLKKYIFSCRKKKNYNF